MINEAYAEATLTEAQAAALRRVRTDQSRLREERRRRADQGIVRCIQRHCYWIPIDDVRTGILDGRLLQKTSIETRRSIWMALRHRYFSLDPYVACSLGRATALGLDSVEFKSLAYLYYAIRDAWFSNSSSVRSGRSGDRVPHLWTR